MSSPARIAVAILLVASTARVARAQSPGSDERAPIVLVVSEAPPEAEPRYEAVWFGIGGPIFAGGAALAIVALAIDDDSASPAFGAISAIPLSIGAVLLIVGVVRWVDIDGARARFRERAAATVAFDPATLTLRW